MASERELERAQNRLARSQALAQRQSEELDRMRSETEAAKEMEGFLPKTVDSEVRQGIAMLSGLLPGVANEATGLPEPIIPAAELAAGLTGQFLLDLSPEWNEAAVGVTEGAGAVTAYLVGRYVTRGLMDSILHSTPAK